MRAPRSRAVATPMEVPGVRPPSITTLRSVVSGGFGKGGSAIPAWLRCAAHESTGALQAEATSRLVVGGRR
jgi:hypothetical protein